MPTPEIARELYHMMLLIRETEEALVAPILAGEVGCPVHLCSGQEAVAAGVGANLLDTDYVFGNHRSHGHFLAKTRNLRGLVAEVFCRSTGCSRGRGGSMHLYDVTRGFLGSAPIVGGTIPLAIGSALAAQIRGDGRVAVSFFGDGATGEGVLYESLNFAALRRLPMVFICENNLYSTHMSIQDCRANVRVHETIDPILGGNCVVVDGNDVLKVYEVAMRAIEACRDGKGPGYIECLTYRQRGHVGPDDNIQGTHTDIRPPEEIAEWLSRDPVERMRKHLLSNGMLTRDEDTALRDTLAREIADALAFARNSDFPKQSEIGDYVFCE